MKKKIAVLPGDGIGPEIVDQALNVLYAIEKKYDHEFTLSKGLIGAVAIDETGTPLPTETLDLCLDSDAILFGAIGDPKYDNDPKAKVRPEQGLLAIRKALGLYANIRPVVNFEILKGKSPLKDEIVEGVDLIIIRELTGGLYFGEPRERRENGTVAIDTCVYSKMEIIRIVKVAFGYAMRRKKKLCVVDKANVLETSRLWRETVQEMIPDYPEVEVEFMFVDNAAMKLIVNPRSFDVMVTENLFGDILSDEASVITGSIGLLPSASSGDLTALYEPVHGSYPQATGKGIANPVATILSLAMLLEDSFGLSDEAADIRAGVDHVLGAGICTEDINPTTNYSTSVVGNAIAEYIGNNGVVDVDKITSAASVPV
ncbi:MAG: 3-isopropylmalate dehydrogenase [Flavobacteriales bacterium]|nr:3-isopropylmalate dehydrogenase [Flavobacteriales bacterium]